MQARLITILNLEIHQKTKTNQQIIKIKKFLKQVQIFTLRIIRIGIKSIRIE